MRDEVQRDHPQEQRADGDGLGIPGKAAEQPFRSPLHQQSKGDHHRRTQPQDALEGLLHTLAISSTKILPRNGAGREGDRKRRHMGNAEQARPDAEARLGRSAKMAERIIDRRHVGKDDPEFAARRQADVQDPPPLPELRTP